MRERQPGESAVGAAFMEARERVTDAAARFRCRHFGHVPAAWGPVCRRCWRVLPKDRQ